MATTLICALKECAIGDLKEQDARVEVKAFVVEDAKKKHLHINWNRVGEATFHYECWKIVSKSAKSREPLALTQLEVDLVNEAKKTVEYFDSHDSVMKEAKRIAEILRGAKYAIAFTGAGISTSAGIGDFRGKAGAWTERDRKKEHGAKATGASRGKAWTYASLRPTYTHEAIAKLVELGLLKHVISQNVDGLHRLSGVPASKISELHGNCFHEKCEFCGKRYERSSAVGGKSHAVPPRPCPTCGINHRTGRKCEAQGCSGFLMNTIINFGDNLESDVIDAACANARRNDAVLCLGTSLRVTPACDMVTMGSDPPRLIICNRQPTPFDQLCSGDGGTLGARVFADCDLVMREVMAALLPEAELSEWEDGRAERLTLYAEQRDE